MLFGFWMKLVYAEQKLVKYTKSWKQTISPSHKTKDKVKIYFCEIYWKLEVLFTVDYFEFNYGNTSLENVSLVFPSGNRRLSVPTPYTLQDQRGMCRKPIITFFVAFRPWRSLHNHSHHIHSSSYLALFSHFWWNRLSFIGCLS